jgi:Transposase DNA-binding/Transposase DDE domain
MKAMRVLEAKEWAVETFGEVELGDPRRRDRVVQVAAAMAEDPAATLPTQMGDPSALHAAYRVLNNEAISFEQLQEPHWHHTREQARQRKQVLLVQDTTDLNYSQHPKTKGLGPIGRSNKAQGFFVQSVLAVDAQTEEMLGLAYEEPFVRQPAPVGETHAQRLQRDRESLVWERAVQAIGPTLSKAQWIHVGDRGADIFRLLQYIQLQGCDFLIRAAQNRCVQAEHGEEEEDEEVTRLFQLARCLPAQDSRVKDLPRLHERPARQASLQVSFQAVRVLPPKNGGAMLAQAVEAWVVRVWEPDPPEGEEPLEWVLLTSVPVENVAQAWLCVDWYTLRWTVEDFHRCLKTGCSMEKRHLQSYQDLTRLLGLVSPLAVRLLLLRSCARQTPQAQAESIMPVLLLRVLELFTNRPLGSLDSAHHLWQAIARLGGYRGYRGDGPPGWQTLWRGWARLQAVLEGVQLTLQFLPLLLV